MDMFDAGYELLKSFDSHLSDDNPFMGSDTPSIVKQFELMEDAATAVKKLLLHMNISDDMRANIEKLENI